MKRVFGKVEVIFDICYLVAAAIMGISIIIMSKGSPVKMAAGVMALLLVFGDAFHLLPRISTVIAKGEKDFSRELGRGKQIASITMTVFYLLLLHIGVMLFTVSNSRLWYCIVFALAAIRIIICLLPQNDWYNQSPPVSWGLIRNLPFFILGLIVAWFYFINRSLVPVFSMMWLAILLSFVFYLPVVVWSNKNRKAGMLMLPKTCMYLWMIAMCLYL